MAKITAKASLIQNSNLFLHIADKGGVDVALAFVSGVEWTITSATAAWVTTGSADANGVINRAIVVGDVITFSHSSIAGNEGITFTVTGVTATVITVDELVGTPTAESAGSDINIVAFKKTYQFVEAGAMSFVDGCQGIVLASKLVDMWDTLDLDKYDRPFTSIEPRAKSLASLSGWEPHDTDTLNGVRDTALEIRDDATSAARQIYALWRSGSLNAGTDQFNFWPSSDSELTAPTAAVMQGYVNQLFLIYDANGADNRQSNGVAWFTRCAEEGKTIVMEQHNVDYAEIMPVSAANGIDPKLVASDATVGAGGIYALVLYNSDIDGVYEGAVDGPTYNFDGYVEGNGQSNQTVHEKINYLLRQAVNINNDGAGATMRGDKQWPLTAFSGDVFTLQTYLLNYDASQRNDLRVVDNIPTTRQWPSAMTLTISAPTLVVGGTLTIYHADSFGTAGAIIFQNESAANQQDIAITSTVSVVMAFSTYAVDGHTPGQALAVKIAYNRPGFVEPDVIDAVLNGSNLSVAISPKADPSYIA
ncbi:MAG: hypothetical protein HRT93_02965 [Piscirickettsiaceae bacterium]|nr:hypothetical protein [Piscirickettsiaceae bacterium]